MYMHLQSKSLAVMLSPEVGGFAAVLEARLRMHGLGSRWKKVPYEEVLRQLQTKVIELVENPRGRGAFHKAVLVGLLAMMAADHCAALQRLNPEVVMVQPPSKKAKVVKVPARCQEFEEEAL